MARQKVELTQEQIIEKMQRRRELGRLRSKKFYENNKEKVLSRVKEYNQQIKQKYQNIIKNIQPTEPEQPQEEDDASFYITVQPKKKKTKINQQQPQPQNENENDDETFYITPKKKQSKTKYLIYKQHLI